MINNSSFAFLSYRYLKDAGVPTIGGGFDGTYYGEKGNEDILSALGNSAPFSGLAYDNLTKLMKQAGAKKLAGVAYGASASSTASAKTTVNIAGPAQGLDPVYLNTTVEFGTLRRRPARDSGSRTPVPTRPTCRWWRNRTWRWCRTSSRTAST